MAIRLKKTLIALPYEEMEIHKDGFKVGGLKTELSGNEIALQTSGKTLFSGSEDTYIVKIISEWKIVMLAAFLMGIPCVVTGGIGLGLSLRARRLMKKGKIRNVSIPLSKQQVIDFFKAVSQMNASIEIEDYSKNSYPWITENIKPLQKKGGKGKIVVIIFPRMVAGT
jgi:hypothetical protein